MDYLKYFDNRKIRKFDFGGYIGNMNNKSGVRLSEYLLGNATLANDMFYDSEGNLLENYDLDDFNVYNAANTLASSGKHFGRKANINAINQAAAGISNTEDREAFIKQLTDAYNLQADAKAERWKRFGAGAGKAIAGITGQLGGAAGAVGTIGISEGIDAALLGDVATATTGIVGGAVTQAVGAVDNALMGDKNFSAGSKAIDTTVHGVSGALMKSGNPIAMGVGAGLEALNFATKALGKNVEGYDVNIDNSGYGQLGHMDSQAGRVWDNWNGTTERRLLRRNEQAKMALAAADVSAAESFEQEARQNSVQDVMQLNQIALAGGVDTSILAAKNGAKIEKKITWDDIIELPKQEIIKAQNGAKLENVEVSKEKNVIPEGELHKNKHDLDLDDITKKGIPVVTVKDDSAETFEDIKEQEDTLVQHAEIESLEIIFNKELTDYIEEARKKWHESEDSELALEVGKRLVKEILTNTDDNTDLITKMEELV